MYGRTAWKSTPRYQALSPLAKEAGWGSQVSRGAHNPEVGGSKGGTATKATSTITGVKPADAILRIDTSRSYGAGAGIRTRAPRRGQWLSGAEAPGHRLSPLGHPGYVEKVNCRALTLSEVREGLNSSVLLL